MNNSILFGHQSRGNNKFMVHGSWFIVWPFMNMVVMKFGFLNFLLITIFIISNNSVYISLVKRNGDGLCWGATHRGISLPTGKLPGKVARLSLFLWFKSMNFSCCICLKKPIVISELLLLFLSGVLLVSFLLSNEHILWGFYIPKF